MKTYELEEAIKMLKENNKLEFEINRINNSSVLFIDVAGRLKCEDKKSGSDDYILAADKWKLIQQPVTFMEAVKSTKRVKVEHEYISNLIRRGHDSLKNYMPFAGLMSLLSDYLVSSDLKQVILNGKWYIGE